MSCFSLSHLSQLAATWFKYNSESKLLLVCCFFFFSLPRPKPVAFAQILQRVSLHKGVHTPPCTSPSLQKSDILATRGWCWSRLAHRLELHQFQARAEQICPHHPDRSTLRIFCQPAKPQFFNWLSCTLDFDCVHCWDRNSHIVHSQLTKNYLPVTRAWR